MRDMAHSICLIKLYQITMRKKVRPLFLITTGKSCDKMAVVNLGRFSYWLFNERNVTNHKKYDNRRIKSENHLVWYMKQDNNPNDKTQTILF